MTLPEPLRSFWYAWGALGPVVRPTSWGQVVADPRFPQVWESNRAAVLVDDGTVRAGEIRAVLTPELRGAGATHEHIEFWDPKGSRPALEDLRPEAERVGEDVAMVFAGDGSLRPPSDAEIEEVPQPDEDFWRLYRDSRDEFGGALSPEIIDELVARDRQVLVPAGLRVFVGTIDGEMGGFVSLISLAGVGYIDNVVTFARHRRRGLASGATLAAVRASRDQGDEVVHLLAERDGRPRGLYERLGFEVRARVTSLTRRLPGP